MNNSETKQCQNCNNEFVIEPEDFEFYDKIHVPPPTFCPECRMVRRMLWRNERTLYKRKCNAPGHSEEIISIYHKDSTLKVYDNKYWWSDEWDLMDCGRDYDFNKPFFEQFSELLNKVPRINLLNINPVNTEYAHLTADNKDCYLLFESSNNEKCDYGYWMQQSKNCVDCSFVNNSELCYETILSQNCFKVFYCKECRDCIDSFFLKDCVDCSDCFGCVGLRHKKYHILNKEYSKEEYFKILEEKKKEIKNGNIEKLKKEFNEFILKYPNKYSFIQKSVNSMGEYLLNTKNCKLCFDCYDAEDCKYGQHLWRNAKDIMDAGTVGREAELVYESINSAIGLYNVKFSMYVTNSSSNCQYSDTCQSSSNLFGCISLRNKQYCILNKQYTKEEYEKLVPKIIEHMNNMPYIDKKGRVYKYGEFFPPELSPFAYNETIAQEYFPLTKEQAIAQGYQWREQDERNYQIDIKSEDLPDHIKDIKDDIVNKVIQCAHYDIDKKQTICNEQCATAFKIIPRELEFYRKNNLPIPRLCPNCRHYQRIKQRNPLKLWHRKCQCAGKTSDNKVYENTIEHPHHKQEHCPVEFETSYSPERKEIVYCEKCYQAEVV